MTRNVGEGKLKSFCSIRMEVVATANRNKVPDSLEYR